MRRNIRLQEKILLENGLSLEIWDHTRRVAGDRYLVKLEIRIPVEVKKEYFEKERDGDLLYETMLKQVGTIHYFRIYETRNFIDKREIDKVKELALVRVKKNILPYVSRYNFPKSFLLKEARELKKRLSWYGYNDLSIIDDLKKEAI